MEDQLCYNSKTMELFVFQKHCASLQLVLVAKACYISMNFRFANTENSTSESFYQKKLIFKYPVKNWYQTENVIHSNWKVLKNTSTVYVLPYVFQYSNCVFKLEGDSHWVQKSMHFFSTTSYFRNWKLTVVSFQFLKFEVMEKKRTLFWTPWLIWCRNNSIDA